MPWRGNVRPNRLGLWLVLVLGGVLGQAEGGPAPWKHQRALASFEATAAASAQAPPWGSSSSASSTRGGTLLAAMRRGLAAAAAVGGAAAAVAGAARDPEAGCTLVAPGDAALCRGSVAEEPRGDAQERSVGPAVASARADGRQAGAQVLDHARAREGPRATFALRTRRHGSATERPVRPGIGVWHNSAAERPARPGTGVDTLGVRRDSAPALEAYARGSAASACDAVRGQESQAATIRDAVRGAFALTTRATDASRWATLRRIAVAGRVRLIPARTRTLRLIAGALKRGRYRSGAAYLSLWKRKQRTAGLPWGPDLEEAQKEITRSLRRGLGPSVRANTVRLEDFLGVDVTRAPTPGLPRNSDAAAVEWPLDCFAVASFWMLRGAEAAAILIEQVCFSKDGPAASIALGATKNNPEGRECSRTLRCACGGLTRRVCPVHSLVRIIAAMRERGATGKHPLFAGRVGRAISRKDWVLTVRAATGAARLSEHSARRTGAQYYARRGVVVAVIQFLGRWGSDTVLRYIGEAMHDRAAHAASAAAAAAGDGATVVANFAPAELRRLVKEMVDEVAAVKFGASPPGATLAPVMGLALEDRVEEVMEAIVKAKADAEVLARASVEKHLVLGWGGVRGARGVVTHQVEIGDARYPVASWRAFCGWPFGLAACERRPVQEADCKKCRDAVSGGRRGGQSGGSAAVVARSAAAGPSAAAAALET